MAHDSNPPYFDRLLGRLEAGDRAAVAAFGQHVHWGYWDDVPADLSPDSYGTAAERLCGLVLDVAELQDGQRIADVGCGFGGTIASINGRHHGMEMAGVNIDVRQLKRAAELVPPRDSNSICWIAGDAAALPFATISLHRILAVECIFHFDRRRFLAEACRTMVPGGRLVITDFIPHERALPFLRDMGQPAADAIRWMYGNVDFTCSMAQYAGLAEKCGLSLIKVEDVTQGTLPTYDFLRAAANEWMTAEERPLFQAATDLLEKASRRGLMSYKILVFDAAAN